MTSYSIFLAAYVAIAVLIFVVIMVFNSLERALSFSIFHTFMDSIHQHVNEQGLQPEELRRVFSNVTFPMYSYTHHPYFRPRIDEAFRVFRPYIAYWKQQKTVRIRETDGHEKERGQ